MDEIPATDQRPHSPRGTLPAFTSVPRLRDRSNGWKPEIQRAFNEALADTGSVKSACRKVGRAEVGAYLLRRHPEAESFRNAWQAALDLGMQRIEDVAMDRALNGVDVPVYSYGKLVGARTVYNDRLLMFMLRNRAPERFAEGRPKGMNAVDAMELKRLKKQWREEWEAERPKDRQAIIARLDRKLDAMQRRALARMSPRTLSAQKEFDRLRAADEAAHYCGYDDPEHPLYEAPRAAEEAEQDSPALPPPDWRERKAEEPEDEEPRIRKLKDEGWD